MADRIKNGKLCRPIPALPTDPGDKNGSVRAHWLRGLRDTRNHHMPSMSFPAGANPMHPGSLIGRDFQNPVLKMRSYPPSPLVRWGALLLAFALAFAPALSGALFGPDEWYAALNKAPWNPPNWLLGLVWTALYSLSAIAAWRMFDITGRVRVQWFGFYGRQLLLNGLWTVTFFGLHAPLLSLIVISALVATLVGTIEQFRRQSVTCARLMLPMLYWVVFAASLNAYIVLLN
jgi:translocator protein